jgi:hypothetical protein
MADLAFTQQKQRSALQSTAFRLPPAHQELTPLPCTLQSETGQYMRSYPGAPGVIGWTLFLRTAVAYVYNGDPVFTNERDAIRYLRKKYQIKIHLNRNDSLHYSEW